MNLRTTRLTVALLLGVVAAGCFPPPGQNSNGDDTSVKITYPADDGTVAQSEVVRGTSQNVPQGHQIWVVVFVHKAGRYYPQNNPAVVQPDGHWNSMTYFGVDADAGLKFDALAVTADAGAQSAIRAYLKDAADRKDFAGLTQLPPGATQQHGVTVTRK